MQCPECGADDGPLHIETVTKATVAMHRDGFDPLVLLDGDTTWSGESACRCPCGFADKVAAFRLPKEDEE
jgi:hypothetical protein